MKADPEIGKVVGLYNAILGSAATEVDRTRNGAPLTQEEIPLAAAYMDQLAERIRERREADTP